MSEQKEKHNEKRQMLMYTMTLGESDLSAGFLVNNNQLGWHVVPIRSSPLLLNVLGILQISD